MAANFPVLAHVTEAARGGTAPQVAVAIKKYRKLRLMFACRGWALSFIIFQRDWLGSVCSGCSAQDGIAIHSRSATSLTPGACIRKAFLQVASRYACSAHDATLRLSSVLQSRGRYRSSWDNAERSADLCISCSAASSATCLRRLCIYCLMISR